MPVPTFTGLGPFPTFDDVVRKFSSWATDMNFLLTNMDSLNVTHLTADTIDAGTLNANLVTIRSDLTNGYIQIDGNGMVINNGSYNTFSVDMSGLLTMTAAVIQSAIGYPKVTMNLNGNIFGAFQDANNYIGIVPYYSNVNAPAIQFWRGGAIQSTFLIGSGGLEARSISGGYFSVIGGDLFVNNVNNITDGINTIGMLLNGKATKGASTSTASSINGGIPIGASWSTSAGTVTWNGVPAHSHTQT